MVEQLKDKVLDKKSIEAAGKNFFEKLINSLPDYLKKRFIPALIMMPSAIIIIYTTPLVFELFIIIMAVLMAFEWITIAKTEEETNMWRMLGLIYILIPCFSLVYLRGTTNGSDIILWLCLVVWATDIGGLVVGVNVGGPKLAPTISPNKTWSGLGGGVLASMFIGLITSLMFKEGAMFFIVFSGIIAIIEQMSDLLESKFKRYFGVKDSGNLIPGHGGIMDRVDGFTLTAPIVAILALFSNSIF